MKITCIKKNGNGTKEDIKEIDLIDEVLYIEMEKRIPLFHTRNGLFYQIVTLGNLFHWLEPYGYKKLDATNLVKMDKIKYIDSNKLIVYFDDGSTTTISKYGLDRIKESDEYQHLIV